MHQPATTNPLIIMCINMTIVFAVLIGLSFMMRPRKRLRRLRLRQRLLRHLLLTRM